jgi:HKD family nuclease
MTAMKTHYGSLPQILDDIRNRSQIAAGVILTYEFDPLLAHSLARTELLQLDDSFEDRQIRFEGAFPACLFYDPKRSRNLPNFPGNFEIHFKSKSGFSCHHSKAYAFALENGSFELVLGSFNLTEAGLFQNRETFLEFRLDSESPDADVLGIFRQWRDFLSINYETAVQTGGLSEYLNRLNRRLESFSSIESGRNLILLSSGYNLPQMKSKTSGLQNLKQFCEKLPNGPLAPTHLLVISPFFDKIETKKSILKEFHTEFPSLSSVSIFSAYNSWSKAYFDGFSDDKVRYFCIPTKISEAEIKAIDNFHDGARISLKKSNKFFYRKLHSKVILLLDNSGKGLLYIGSANFTTKAWLGENFELGAAGVINLPNISDSNWDKHFVENLLGIDVGEAIALSDTEFALPQTSDEDEFGNEILPCWLESIFLAPPSLEEANQALSSEDKQNITSFAGQFLFFGRKNKTLPDPLQLKKSFSFGTLDVTPMHHAIDAQGREYLASRIYPFCVLREHLSTCRVVEMTSSTDYFKKKPQSPIYIPFNIDPVFGRKADYSVHVKPECGLRFLADLCMLKGSAKRNAQATTDECDQIYERSQHGYSDLLNTKISRTHMMRAWITDLGRLENALIVPGLPEQGDSLVSHFLRKDIFASLLAYAEMLQAPDVGFGEIRLEDTEKTFMIMELAVLAARLGAAAVDTNIEIDCQQTSAIKKLKDLALELEQLYFPKEPITGHDPYRDLLYTYYNRFMHKKGKLEPKS